jgi:hypothetical protein
VDVLVGCTYPTNALCFVSVISCATVKHLRHAADYLAFASTLGSTGSTEHSTLSPSSTEKSTLSTTDSMSHTPSALYTITQSKDSSSTLSEQRPPTQSLVWRLETPSSYSPSHPSRLSMTTVGIGSGGTHCSSCSPIMPTITIFITRHMESRPTSVSRTCEFSYAAS